MSEQTPGAPEQPPDDASEHAAEPVQPRGTAPDDPLRVSRAGAAWVGVASLAVLLVLLLVFIAQNTARVAVRFLGWTWHAPLAVVVLSGVAIGMLLAVVAGSLRIWQLRRRLKRVA